MMNVRKFEISVVNLIAAVVASLAVSFHCIAYQDEHRDTKSNRVDELAVSYISNVKHQAELKDLILKERLQGILPALMSRENIDMWLLISREYNEDPILKTMLPSDWLHARRRTMLVFVRDPVNAGNVKRYTLGRYDIGEFYQNAWDKKTQSDQYMALAALIKQYQVRNIAINESLDFGLADGLVATEKRLLLNKLPESLHHKIISSEPLAVSWLETRTATELAHYKTLVELTKAMIQEAFSARVIVPGKTTTDDVIWWLRQRTDDLGLQTWFQPSISIQRKAGTDTSSVIQYGDLLHVDFGLSYLGLHSDIQQHAYVLKNNEQDAPDGLKQALKVGNQLQSILTSQFQQGMSGNKILSNARAMAIDKGLQPTIYSHPIGPYGHNAGTSIGMWDNQEFLQGSGEWPLHGDTAYAIELNVKTLMPEWQREIRIMLEENAWFDGKQVRYFYPRQESLILVR
ncbi:M24 family metallopeptidase [Thalassotalea litorea]|uniref:M24 family metallopeptidase n=1 Tax=Thalassotalea litorea TaxID=2020715 RepID=UPI003736A740